MFKEIASVPNLPELEKQTTEYWKQIDVVNALKAVRKGKKEMVYYDGPITANGMPHYGHAITWTLKDVVPRYWYMKGYTVERSMGWDTKGILVEFEVEKALGFKRKEDIREYGEAKFIQKCRDFVEENKSLILEYETKIGRWFDPAIIYSTSDASYVESMWWALSELYKKDLLYEGHKTVAYSTRAGTTLSTHEVSEGGYKEIEDPFVTVKFKVKSKYHEMFNIDNQNDAYLLAWTTTPWTIPGNLMIAANKDLTYVKVQIENTIYIVAKDRVKALFEEESLKILEEFKGDKLEGIEYDPPFKYFESKRADGCFKVVLSPHANAEDGTGLVHLAPYGEEDYEIFMGLGIKLFDYLDDTANFTNLIPEYEGLFYKNANSKIIGDLKKSDVLFNSGTLVHRMPICYRTGTPLIYKPVKSWYIAVTKIKQRMVEENQKTNWMPEHLRDGNSGIWIQNARDWALSRSRYWGTPMPIWVNDKTGKQVFIDSFKELEKLSGKKITDPHRPYIDEITWADNVNGGTFRRVKDVIDVWLDSGCMPFAHIHYPFENIERFKQIMPAEYISEGPDQVRLWFYVMHVLGVALFDQIPYKNVVTIGMMLDENGKKMSKSKRNYKPMDEVLALYGGDILRYFILTSPIVKGSDVVFKEQYLTGARKEFFLILWNSLKYFVTYANLHNFKPTLDEPKSKNILDKWMAARLKETINTVTEKMDTYNIMEAANQLEPLSTDLSTWFIRRSRDRIKSGDLNAIHTLYDVLCQFTKLMAPMLPFLSEIMYEILNLRQLTGLKSVHMDLYPAPGNLSDEEVRLLDVMANTRGVVSSALSIRVTKGIKVRQPLNTLYVEEKNYVEELILDEVNVKRILKGEPSLDEKANYEYAEKNHYPVWLETTITNELKLEGASREIIRALQDLRKEQNLKITDKIKAVYEQTDLNSRAVEKFGKEIKQKILAQTLNPGTKYEVTKV